MKIEIILGHVEAVSVAWVVPLVKVDGMSACKDNVATQDHLFPVENPQPGSGQMAVARFSENAMLYRGRVVKGGMVEFIDNGNGELIQEGLLYKMPKDLENHPIKIEARVLNTEENMMKVEENLGTDNIFLLLEDGTVGTFYKGEEPVRDF